MQEIPELESARPEVKRYERQKLVAGLASTFFGLAWLGILGFGVGPVLWPELYVWTGLSPVLRLLAVAFFIGLTSEGLTLPLDFYSSYLLEHRYHLSNQTFAGWVLKRVKGYLVGALRVAHPFRIVCSARKRWPILVVVGDCRLAWSHAHFRADSSRSHPAPLLQG